MDNNGQGFSLIDAIGVVSFMIGLANYTENVDQSKMNDAIKAAVADVHAHLEQQDTLLKEIKQLLEDKNV